MPTLLSRGDLSTWAGVEGIIPYWGRHVLGFPTGASGVIFLLYGASWKPHFWGKSGGAEEGIRK